MKAIVVEGPIGVGKSKVAFTLAKALNSAIVVADTPKLYSKFNLGANKPSAQMQKAIPYHLLSKYDPKAFSLLSPLTLWQFRADAMAALQAVWAKNQIPVLEGGSYLYLKCLIYGKEKAQGIDISSDLRAKVKDLINAHREDWDMCVSHVQKNVPGVEVNFYKNDFYRLEKATLLALSGKQPTLDSYSTTPLFDARIFYLNMDGDSIQKNIDTRCEKTVEAGLVEETIDLILSGDFNIKEARHKLPENSMGYAETFQYIQKLLGMVRQEKLVDKELVALFYGYLVDYICNIKKNIKEQRKTFRYNAGDIVSIDYSLDSYAQLPLSSLIPRIMNLTNMSRVNFDLEKGASPSFNMKLGLDSRINWTIYPRQGETPEAALATVHRHVQLLQHHNTRLASLGL